MAKHYLYIPVSKISVESLFSKAGTVISEKLAIPAQDLEEDLLVHNGYIKFRNLKNNKKNK